MLVILLLMLPFQAVHYLLGDALMGLGRQGLRSALQATIAASSVILNFLLIPSVGWRGSAWISVGTSAGLAVATLTIVLLELRRSTSSRASRERGTVQHPRFDQE